LYVVGTPIGNLDDITLRALETLRRVDVVSAEDTRRTGRLLSHFGIRKRLLSCHEHNEKKRAAQLVEWIRAGREVALVTDAGMPSVSDPGYALVVAVLAAGLSVVPVPGVSAVTTALSVAGLPTDSFLFVGFAPRKALERRRFIEGLSGEGRTLIFFESPRRIVALLEDISHILGQRRVVLAREMTKRYEEFLRGSLSDVLDILRGRQTIRGEVTLLVAPDSSNPVIDGEALDDEIALRLGQGLPLSEVSRQVAGALGISKNLVYRRALEIKTGDDGE
jgi:16S rRNA (cytidine1402-2'-O)-methyltransferase